MASLIIRFLGRRAPKCENFMRPIERHRFMSVFVYKPNCRGIILPLDKCIQAKQHYYRKHVQFYSNSNKDSSEVEKRPSLFERFKMMYKEYWYVLVPVHLVTSAAWFAGFYYLAKSGVDVAALLESWSVSEKLVDPLKKSNMGYLAVAYALYKIATPARYTVTLGGTTISINYLKKWGYIKPVPSREKLKEMLKKRKGSLLETVRETRDGLKTQVTEKLRDKSENIMDDIDKSISHFKDKMEPKEPLVGAKKKK